MKNSNIVYFREIEQNKLPSSYCIRRNDKNSLWSEYVEWIESISERDFNFGWKYHGINRHGAYITRKTLDNFDFEYLLTLEQWKMLSNTDFNYGDDIIIKGNYLQCLDGIYINKNPNTKNHTKNNHIVMYRDSGLIDLKPITDISKEITKDKEKEFNKVFSNIKKIKKDNSMNKNGLYCIIGDDRVCHGEILFTGSYQECKEKVNPWYNHPKYGGINASIKKKSVASSIVNRISS